MEEPEGYVLPVAREVQEHRDIIAVREVTVARKIKETEAEVDYLNKLKNELELLLKYQKDRMPQPVVECSEGDGRPAKTKGLCERCYKRALRLAKKQERLARKDRAPFYGEGL